MGSMFSTRTRLNFNGTAKEPKKMMARNTATNPTSVEYMIFSLGWDNYGCKINEETLRLYMRVFFLFVCWSGTRWPKNRLIHGFEASNRVANTMSAQLDSHSTASKSPFCRVHGKKETNICVGKYFSGQLRCGKYSMALIIKGAILACGGWVKPKKASVGI
jgi:hypothetical protein